jgi:hypothetical protein
MSERQEGLGALSPEQVRESRLYCLRKRRENTESSLIRYGKMMGFLEASLADIDKEIREVEKGV